MFLIDIFGPLNRFNNFYLKKTIMKKFLLFVGIAMLSFASANAQVKFGFGLGYASPMGDASDFLDGGISAHLEVGYGVTEDIDVSFLIKVIS